MIVIDKKSQGPAPNNSVSSSRFHLLPPLPEPEPELVSAARSGSTRRDTTTLITITFQHKDSSLVIDKSKRGPELVLLLL